MIVETHIHLNHKNYDDVDDVIKRATEANVTKLIDIGCDKESIPKSLEISNKYQNIKSAIGLHPVDVTQYDPNFIEYLENLISNNKQVIAIGEIGLDYHWYPEQKEQQKKVFHEQMKLAQKLNLPVIIHSREAYDDCYEIVKDYPNVTGVIHSFSADYEMAQKFIKLGYYIGIGGPVTFKNGHNQKDVVKNIDISKLLIETDGPYLTPTPHRGKRNEPAYLTFILEEIAELRNEDISIIEDQIYKNSLKLFEGLIND